MSKKGGHGRGCAGASKAASVAAGKMPALKVDSPVVAMKLVSVVAPAPPPDAVVESQTTQRMLTLANSPLLQVISDEEDEEEDEEKKAREGLGEGKGDESS